MKKIVILTFLFFYSFVSFGVSVNVHFCGGQYESISLFFNDQKSCCCSGGDLNLDCENEDNGCCEYHHFTIEKSDHEKVDNIKANLSANLFIPNVINQINYESRIKFLQPNKNKYSLRTFPFRRNYPDIHIVNNQFLI